MYRITDKDRIIARKGEKKNRITRALVKLEDRINADDTAFHGAVNAGLIPVEYPIIDLNSLKRFIIEAKNVGIVTASIETDQGRDQVVMELRRWR